MKNWVDFGFSSILRWFTCPQKVTHPRSNHLIVSQPGVQSATLRSQVLLSNNLLCRGYGHRFYRPRCCPTSPSHPRLKKPRSRKSVRVAATLHVSFVNSIHWYEVHLRLYIHPSVALTEQRILSNTQNNLVCISKNFVMHDIFQSMAMVINVFVAIKCSQTDGSLLSLNSNL